MSTRSWIGIKNDDSGPIQAVYCHLNGFPTGVGAVLEQHYNDRKKVAELIELGFLSFIMEKVRPDKGESHSYDEPAKGVTVDYHRDRREPYEPPDEYATREHLFEAGKKSAMIAYLYLFEDGIWWVTRTKTENWMKIKDAIAQEQKESNCKAESAE